MKEGTQNQFASSGYLQWKYMSGMSTTKNNTAIRSSPNKSPVLFYSTFCNYCRMVLKFMKQNEMTDAFSLFQVDGNRNQIPRFVTSVPTLLLPDKRMLTDEAVWEYIKKSQEFRKARENQMGEVSPLKSSCGFGTFENLEGLPCDDLEDDGTYVRFDANPSITGVSTGDPSKPLSEAQIMSANNNISRGNFSFEAFQKQRDDALSQGVPVNNGPFMGGSLSGTPR